jgi:hypothetical protein
MALPAPQSKPPAPAPRLGARIAPSVAIKLGFPISGRRASPRSTVLLFQALGRDFVANATIIRRTRFGDSGATAISPRELAGVRGSGFGVRGRDRGLAPGEHRLRRRDTGSGVRNTAQQQQRVMEQAAFIRVELALQNLGEPGLTPRAGRPQEITSGGGQLVERAAAVGRVRTP